MKDIRCLTPAPREHLEHPGFAGDLAEFVLVLPVGQAAALEEEAHQHGLTVAQLLRVIIRDFLRER